jgi:hypothetical protein
MSEPQHNLTVDHLEVVAGREREQIEGWVPDLASEAELRDALEKAFDYRGDVTITCKDGSRVEGYIFDRRNAATLAESVLHCRTRFFRTRHGCRQELGSLGPQVLGEESGRREGLRIGTRGAGVAHKVFGRVPHTSAVFGCVGLAEPRHPLIRKPRMSGPPSARTPIHCYFVIPAWPRYPESWAIRSSHFVCIRSLCPLPDETARRFGPALDVRLTHSIK